MSETKIQVKVGIVEFSGEGNQDWLAEQLDKILVKVPELLKIEMAAPNSHKVSNIDRPASNYSASSIGNLSVINIAGILNCKSGADLVIAACAFMHFMESKSTFTREDITGTMKKATGYYKNSHLANLTTILTGLEKSNTLTKISTTYALNIDKVNELNAILSK